MLKNSSSIIRAACIALVALFSVSAQAQVINVTNASELQNAVAQANSAGGNRTIVLANGTYTLTDTLYINAPGITLTSASGNRASVIIQGDAMSSSARVKTLVRAGRRNFTISNLTLQKSGWHLLQVVGETDADNAVVRNVVFRDAYEQMLKGSIDQSNYNNTADNGLVEDSLFEYTAGIGPQYYIGGVDVHGGKNWIVRRNTFKSIISPSREVAEFAIHFWNQTADALVEKNTIINCDRAIGFGLDGRGNSRGIIRNNMVYHSGTGSFADVAIYLDESPGTQIYNNSIYMEGSYPRSIEYRFADTNGVLIVNNLTNKPISSRDGGSGTVGSNVVNASAGWFVNRANGDLRLTSAVSSVVDAGRAVTGLSDDIDGGARPQGSGIDIGADEWNSTGGSKVPSSPTNVRAE